MYSVQRREASGRVRRRDGRAQAWADHEGSAGAAGRRARGRRRAGPSTAAGAETRAAVARGHPRIPGRAIAMAPQAASPRVAA